ncbi:hypothetical protein [Nocardioides pakistanensis]
MKKVNKALAGVGAVAAVGLLVLLVARPSSISTGPDQVALHY